MYSAEESTLSLLNIGTQPNWTGIHHYLPVPTYSINELTFDSAEESPLLQGMVLPNPTGGFLTL